MADINYLIAGYKSFYNKYFEQDKSLYEKLYRQGQTPETLVIACSDSRVDPSIILNAKPGDLFIARNVANLVPPYEIGDDGHHGVSAILEFAVNVIKIKNIVILGHSGCAGINALINSEETMKNTDFVGKWMNLAMTAKERAVAKAENKDGNHLQHKCEKEGIIHSLDNLKTFPWIKSKLDDGSLKTYGWYFTINDGLLYQYNSETEDFLQIK